MVDLLAVTPHPDDAELLCGGTLIRAAEQAAYESGYNDGASDDVKELTARLGKQAVKAATDKQAAVERRDREWCEAVGISEQRGPVASGRTLKVRELLRLKSAAARALEEAAADLDARIWYWHSKDFARWLLARAEQIEKGGNDGRTG